MSFIAFAIFLFLTAIAGIHVAWATGMRWPRKTEEDLVKTVIGYRGHRMPTPGQCCVAAIAIFIPGAIAVLLGGLVKLPLPPSLIVFSGAGAALVFVMRGVAGYAPAGVPVILANHSLRWTGAIFRRYVCCSLPALSL